jgi:hypothetical protein
LNANPAWPAARCQATIEDEGGHGHEVPYRHEVPEVLYDWIHVLLHQWVAADPLVLFDD